MSDGMGREPAYLSSHATNRYFIPNWGSLFCPKGKQTPSRHQSEGRMAWKFALSLERICFQFCLRPGKMDQDITKACIEHLY